ncbi:MAG TPA: hypothetical protein VL634_06840 [Mycobacterium sp.]|jgi:hypothetical protein|nr:hypothetical protein [Mycobacterium sp.]
MNVKQLVAQGAIVGVLAVGAIGAAPVAGADPDWRDWNHNEWVDNDWRANAWNSNGNDWNQWWRVNRWRNDDRPPWGWGPPPAVHWRGGIPHDLDYWGYKVFPFWHPGFHAWGFWLFGIFIPIFVV